MADDKDASSETDSDLVKMTRMKLALAAQFYAQQCPTISRYYVLELASLSQQNRMSPAADVITCRHCGAIFMPDNHTARLVPKMKLNKSLTKLLEKQKQNPRGPLSKFQEKLLKLYKLSKNRLMIRCKKCKRRTTTVCQKRQMNRPKKMNLFAGKGKHMEYQPFDQDQKLSWREKRKQKRKLKKKEKFEQARLDESTTSTDSGVSSNSSFSSLSKSMEDSQLAPLSPHKTSTPVSAMPEDQQKNSRTHLHPFSLTQSVTSLAPSNATTSRHMSSIASPTSFSRSPRQQQHSPWQSATPARFDVRPLHSSSFKDSIVQRQKMRGSIHSTLSRMLASDDKKKDSDSRTLTQFLSSL